MTTEGSTLLSNSQLRHAGGVAGVAAPGPRLEGGGARGVSGERLQLNTGLHRHNLAGDRELKVSEDEIPMVLLELNESALIYIQKEQFENALLLLQKAHGVLDVVDLTRSNRDQYIALQVFYNMAMCY